MTHPYLTGTPTPRVFAHRGLVTPTHQASGIAENSRAAVAAAVAYGVEYIESDCHLTSDGIAVLFHDSNLRRIIGDPREVTAVSFAELADLMIDRGELLTLKDALEEFAGVRFNIDVKAATAAEAAGSISGEHCERVLLTSFSDANRTRALAAAQRVAAGAVGRAGAAGRAGVVSPATAPGRAALIRVLRSVYFGSRRVRSLAFQGLDALQIPERQGFVRVLTPRLIAQAHRAGVEVHVWTVNDPARMRQLVALGVDGIITDRADLALEALR